MGKSSPSAPAPPDYAGAAVAQGAANEATARLQGRMSNPNVIGPLGSQTVTFGTPTFNQAGYDQAMRAYSGQPQRGAAPNLSQFTTTDEGDENRAGRTSIDQAGYSQAMANWANSGVAGPAPTREQFTSNANADQPTVTQTLTPAAQSTLDAQQRVQRALAGLGEQGIGTASNVLGNAFNPNLAGLQTNVGNAGQIPQTPNLSNYGQASGLQGPNIDGEARRMMGRGGLGMQSTGYASAQNPQAQDPMSELSNPRRTPDQDVGNDLRNKQAQPLQAPELSAYGMARSNVNAQPVNAGPQSGQYGMAGAGPQAGQYGFAGGGPGGGQYGLAGANVQAGAINQGPQTGQYGLASGALNTSNVAAMPVNAGMTGQQAIMNRLAPQLERADAQTRQRLINQGLVPGGEAYENAMISQNQQKNDLLSQAALQGIGLDTAANAQGFGQALQAGQYGNQAVAQNFSQAQAAQAAQNAAQQQGFAQQFGLAGLKNQAVGQNFGQGVTAQQLQNAGIGQNFAQGQAANAAGNQAVGQNFGQGLAAQQAQNAASQQLYNQYMGVQGLQNQAVNQNQQAALAQYQAQLGGQQQGFGQNVTQQQLGNQAIAQNQQAALQQQQAALAAQNQQYNQLLQGAQFGNTAQQQSLAQQLALRNQPLNEIAGLMAGSQIQMPQFQGYQGSNIAPAPIFAGAQAAGQSATQNYGIQQAAANANTSGLFGLAGAGLGAYGMMNAAPLAFSDRRLKSYIVRVGTHKTGIGVYEYNIFGNRQRGVMADEVEAIMPEAVILHPSGFKMVNYGVLQ